VNLAILTSSSLWAFAVGTPVLQEIVSCAKVSKLVR